MSKLSLDRILQSQGFGSRKYCRELIEGGEASFNHTMLTDSKAVLDLFVDGLLAEQVEADFVEAAIGIRPAGG